MFGGGLSTILLIDDAGFDLDVEKTFLARHEVRIETVAPGGEVIAAARRLRPRLAVIDVRPPDLAGIGVGRVLRGEPGTRSIPLLAAAAPDAVLGDAETLFDGVVGMPLVQEEFLAAVRRFVPLRERRDARCAVNVRFRFRAGPAWGQAFSRDLSASGAFLKSDHALAPGERIGLRFRIPGEEREIVCEAIVRSAPDPRDAERFGIGFGIEFEGIALDDRVRLARFVGGHLRRGIIGG